MEKQSKTKLLKVLRTLQGYQKMCLGTNVSFDLQVKNYDNTICFIVWIIKDNEFSNLSIYGFMNDSNLDSRLKDITIILTDYGIIKD